MGLKLGRNSVSKVLAMHARGNPSSINRNHIKKLAVVTHTLITPALGGRGWWIPRLAGQLALPACGSLGQGETLPQQRKWRVSKVRHIQGCSLASIYIFIHISCTYI